MKKLICKSGLRKNGTAWYMVDGKFVNKATFMDAYYATDREEVEADIAAMGAVGTPATVGTPTGNYDISPALLLVVSVVVLVFVMVLLGIMAGGAELGSCGKFIPWGDTGVIWFVENTCWGVGSVR